MSKPSADQLSTLTFMVYTTLLLAIGLNNSEFDYESKDSPAIWRKRRKVRMAGTMTSGLGEHYATHGVFMAILKVP